MKGLSGSNSAVECDLAKVEVAGSNPVSRSKQTPHPFAGVKHRKNLGVQPVFHGHVTYHASRAV